MIDIEIRKKVYSQILDNQKYLYENPISGGQLFSIAQKYDLHHDEMYRSFATTVGDIILGFYKIEDTVPLLQQELGLDPKTAALLGADVLDFLSPLSDPNWQLPVEEMREEDYAEEDDNNGQMSSEENVSLPADSVTPPQITNNQPHRTPFSPAENEQPVPTSTTNPIQTYQPIAVPTPYPKVSTPPPTEERYVAPNPTLYTMVTDTEQAHPGYPSARTTPTLNLEEAPTYVSQNQDSLRQPLSSTPTYTPDPTLATPAPLHNPEPPRWSTD